MPAPLENKNARKHGIDAFRTRGPDTLTPAEIGRLAELRLMVRDEPGRRELRQELAARLALIVEIGFAHLQTEAEAGHDIWKSGVIRRLGTYAAELRRCLDSFGDGQAASEQRTVVLDWGAEDTAVDEVPAGSHVIKIGYEETAEPDETVTALFPDAVVADETPDAPPGETYRD